MQLPVSILALIEIALNAYLRLDGEALTNCASLEGKIIALNLKGPALTLYFLPSTQDIQVLGEYVGEPDATIRGSVAGLMRLGASNDSVSTLLETDVEILGDLRSAEAFSKILSDASIDWEEILSKWVGDAAAFQVGSAVRSLNGWLKDSSESMKLNTAEYLSEESRVLPAEAEVREYMDKVDEVRMAVDRLSARISALPTADSANKESADE
ncbi:ubiquinone biosynthesis accessory factor UbiJ [Leucothrix mucor]|uniref:ubiquinone biosynthesis accessory factor UbiJ n=1 Tax=Leucothrix mucor TaxID=45248 RepID=UPI0003B425F5|nr:SCP2 sterol-binding domain-containing protein [Leucothrix mucor]